MEFAVEPIYEACSPIALPVIVLHSLLWLLLLVSLSRCHHLAKKGTQWKDLHIPAICAVSFLILLTFFQSVTDGWDGCPRDLNQAPYEYNILVATDEAEKKALIYLPSRPIPDALFLSHISRKQEYLMEGIEGEARKLEALGFEVSIVSREHLRCEHAKDVGRDCVP